MGIGGYFAQEGVFEFAVKEWGPQPLRLMLSSTDCNAISLGVAKDAGVKEIKDLKGKRVGVVVGSPALNQNAYAILAFGNLTKNDVKLVEFSSYGAMWKGMLNNEVDAAIASNISGQVKEVETSPRGIVYPPTPAADKEGWRGCTRSALTSCRTRRRVAPACRRAARSNCPPTPIRSSWPSKEPADLTYGITRAMIVSYDAYKDAAPGAAGLEVKRQNLAWELPYHEGAVRALKEAGAWKPEHEAHNQKLLKRQGRLARPGRPSSRPTPPEDKDAFGKAWMAARKAALVAVGMDAVFE